MDPTIPFTIVSIIISCAAFQITSLALMFTILSFWWMNWRKGKLHISKPRSFAAINFGRQGKTLVQIPLVFYNDGPTPFVIHNLRLVLEQGGIKSAFLNFNNTVTDLASSDDRQWARQFAVEGRKSISMILVFQRTPGNFEFSVGKCKATLEGKVDKSIIWKKLIEFDLNFTEAIKSNLLIAHDNDVD